MTTEAKEKTFAEECAERRELERQWTFFPWTVRYATEQAYKALVNREVEDGRGQILLWEYLPIATKVAMAKCIRYPLDRMADNLRTHIATEVRREVTDG